jgi:primosomal protein N' (replication factor Y)
MDEEQETSYKQDQTPRYHAREVARWRARDLGALFVMGTATPTLETMQRAVQGEIHLLKLTKRVDNKPMPEVKIVDLKQAADISKKQVIVSSRLREAIEHALAAKRSVLLMLNRRGFSTHIRCLKCGDTLFCTHCAVALTYHQEEGEVLCHYCNFHMEIPKLCVKCNYLLFKFSGIGTEKVESEVARLFPTARVARLDADTARKKGSHEQILSRFRAREIDILVGTQMIAKGFDFQHVNLVGIVNADTGLLLPDFRSSERTFQLLTQMAGRTGRGREAGMVMIQTFSPLHYAIQFSAKHDYNGFFKEEIEKRRSLNYPPFSKLINIAFRGRKESLVQEYALELKQILAKLIKPDMELMGPAPLPLYRLRGHFRWHLMLRGKTVESLQAILRLALVQLKRKTKVYFAIDVDPITIL